MMTGTMVISHNVVTTTMIALQLEDTSHHHQTRLKILPQKNRKVLNTPVSTGVFLRNLAQTDLVSYILVSQYVKLASNKNIDE